MVNKLDYASSYFKYLSIYIWMEELAPTSPNIFISYRNIDLVVVPSYMCKGTRM